MSWGANRAARRQARRELNKLFPPAAQPKPPAQPSRAERARRSEGTSRGPGGNPMFRSAGGGKSGGSRSGNKSRDDKKRGGGMPKGKRLY